MTQLKIATAAIALLTAFGVAKPAAADAPVPCTDVAIDRVNIIDCGFIPGLVANVIVKCAPLWGSVPRWTVAVRRPTPMPMSIRTTLDRLTAIFASYTQPTSVTNPEPPVDRFRACTVRAVQHSRGGVPDEE
jgi:hypothetical protein